MSLLLAEFSLTDALLTTFMFFMLVLWIWIIITIVSDLIRDSETSGWSKAIWFFSLIVIPFFSAFLYMIVRGQGMQERAIASQQAMQSQMDAYVRSTAGSGSAADELEKLAKLKASGTISDSEYESLKAKAIG